MPRLLEIFLLSMILLGCSNSQMPNTIDTPQYRSIVTPDNETGDTTFLRDTNLMRSFVGRTAQQMLDSLDSLNVELSNGTPVLWGISDLKYCVFQANSGYFLEVYVSNYVYMDPAKQSFDHWEYEAFKKEVISGIAVRKGREYYYTTRAITSE